MIRIDRPEEGPVILQTTGQAERLRLCAAYEAAPEGYDTGEEIFAFRSDIYAHDEVKNALRRAQHDKCCFCESKVMHIAFGDVEHFRPKAGFKQVPGSKLQRPGYFWLAYEWTNLFLSCPLCNQRHKESFFPLRRARSRARSHRDDLNLEEPLFVSPSDDPAPFIHFREELLHPVRNNRRGRTTIDALGLNRPELVERRRERLGVVRRILEYFDTLTHLVRTGVEPADRWETEIARTHDDLHRMQADTAEYAAMVRAACAARPDLLR